VSGVGSVRGRGKVGAPFIGHREGKPATTLSLLMADALTWCDLLNAEQAPAGTVHRIPMGLPLRRHLWHPPRCHLIHGNFRGRPDRNAIR